MTNTQNLPGYPVEGFMQNILNSWAFLIIVDDAGPEVLETRMQPLPTFSCAFGFRCMFTPCKGFQILEYRKFFLVESREIFYQQSVILSIGIQDTTQGIWNAPLTIGLRNPSSTDKDCNPVPGIWNPQRGIQNLRLSWLTLQGVSMCTTSLYICL